ncbi:MAG: recombination mediator RecR [Proteobacteria bacterium]|nr:recombination mediator RecR [Pseudomonadota bacterium]
MQSPQLVHLIKLLSRLPGLGPRSGRRAALHLIKNKEQALSPLLSALTQAAESIVTCNQCKNLDTISPCHICSSPQRDQDTLCIVEDVSDLWALERSASFKGQYHVLGGTLSAIGGVGPEELGIGTLIARVLMLSNLREIVIALSATVEGQTTAHYVHRALQEACPHLAFSALAHGIPLGGELDYLDDGTLTTALMARRAL